MTSSTSKHLPAWLVTLAIAISTASTVHADPPAITFENDKFATSANDRGDQLPDYSYSGYRYSETPLPQVKTRIQLQPGGGDDTRAIQQALNELAAMPKDADGWRGALVLGPGTFFVSGCIRLHGDHVVLRGSTVKGQTTTIVATGRDRRALIQVGGHQQSIVRDTFGLDELATSTSRPTSNIVGYVPLGARELQLASSEKFSVGQDIVIRHPATERWIAALKMNRMSSDDPRGSWLDWKPDTHDQLWLRTIVKVDNNRVELDVPLTSALDPEHAQAQAVLAEGLQELWGSFLGIENLRLVSWADTKTNPHDEQHAWDAIQLDRVNQAWVRGITTQQFVGSAVLIGRNSRCITVADCLSTQPVSEKAAWRRQTYLTYGQQCLFLRCQAYDGRHDFAVGYLTPGPNVFSYCEATRASHWSGPLGHWSTGVLYDNVNIDGGGLALTNRETSAQGAGWSAGNCMFWNCVAPVIECRQPPLAFNWAVGVWGEFIGDGAWQAMNEFVSPDSLMQAQLAQRVGKQSADAVLTINQLRAPVPIDCETIKTPDSITNLDDARVANSPADARHPLRIQNGWFTIGNQLAIGTRQTQAWWRGTLLPAKVAEFGPNLLRFVPGINQRYYTDSVDDIADQMQARHAVALEQHWGLWYDRRRDDHQMVRRASADVWPPFYEQPWARSGQGQAWDGLSKYDLTRFNAWYFDRLADFATQADQRGLVLMYSMYFQHNILEAGAHWADFAWRPANCLQATGFPEPPIYENRKRVFMADEFYDVSHPVRRELHTLYIRHCLDVLGHHTNVVMLLGEEFTGPQHFVEFWLETVATWEREHARNVIVILSTTRDVQEAVLQKPALSSVVDAIDMKYWWPTRDGQLVDPPGGQNLAPRQQLRLWQGSKNASAESLALGVRRLRLRYPDKAVLCSVSGTDPWLTLAAGGSFVALPTTTDAAFLHELIACQPVSMSNENSSLMGTLQGPNGQRLEVHKHTTAPLGFVNIDRTTGKRSLSTAQPNNTADTAFRIYWRAPADK
ncbi:MAG: pectate lyase [Pirellulaceae bacterium]|nr:pectate lyase [Pirellulaceae bacterium]